MTRWLSLLLSILLLCSPALANASDQKESPFCGLWKPLHFIQNGQLIPAENASEFPSAFLFTDTTVRSAYDLTFQDEIPYTATGNTGVTEDLLFVLESPELLIVHSSNYTGIFMYGNIMDINNPFLGSWNMECVITDGTVTPGIAFDPGVSIQFAQKEIRILQGNDETIFPCSYADGKCSINATSCQVSCSLSIDGLMHMDITASGKKHQAILSQANQPLAQEILDFLGVWRVLTNIGMGDTEGLRYRFDRACVTEIQGSELTAFLCVYDNIGCHFQTDRRTYIPCTIDSNGLMTIRYAPDKVLWLIREDSIVPAE